MSRRRANNKGNSVWQRNVMIGLCVVLALVLIVLAFGTSYVHHLLNQINRFDPNDQATLSPSDVENMTDPDVETIDPDSTETMPGIEDVTVPTEPAYTPVKHGDHVVNILLVGQDRRPGEGRQRSDSMILISFNTKKNTITLTSFMRDQYVQIPGYQNDKLNAAYAYGGFKLLNESLKVN